MNLIGLCGTIGVGKDTVASILVQDYGFAKDSFASSLKDVISVAFGWDREMMEGATPESRLWREQTDEWWSDRLGQTITPRKMLQLWGTDCIRTHFHDEFWLATVERRIRQQILANPEAKIVLSDVRFPIEAECIRRLGGTIIKITRAKSQDDIKNTTLHSSETSLQSIIPDKIITNDKSLDELKNTIQYLFE